MGTLSDARRAIREAGFAFNRNLNQARGELETGFNQAIETLQPGREAGQGAITRLEELLGLSGDPGLAQQRLEESPGFQFRVDQSNQALQRQQAQLGQTLSGTQLAALSELNQGLASQELNNQVSQLVSLAGLGQQSIAQQASLEAGLGRSLANLQVNKGINEANIINKAAATRTGLLDFSSPSKFVTNLF